MSALLPAARLLLSPRCAAPRLLRPTSSAAATAVPQTAVLMLNMGGPARREDVHDFLLRLFSDTDIINLPMQNRLGPWIARRRTPAIQEKYAEIGGGSPILRWTNLQGELMCRRLDELSPDTAPHKHFVAFRYVHPLTEDALPEVVASGARRLVLFSQYPQYSCATTGSSINALHAYCRENPLPAELRLSVIDRWPTHPGLARSFAANIHAELAKLPADAREKVVLLFSAHSLPLRAVSRGDPYPAEVGATVQAVMAELGHAYPYRLVWQSKVGPLPWMEPATDAAIEAMAKRGHKHLMLVPISFVNEHIETLHELDIEYAKDLGEKTGASIYRVPAPNDHPEFIEALADIVKTHLESGEGVRPQLLMTCPMCTNPACYPAKRWVGETAGLR
ncbi:LOW QUALITY PROTEIN: ferrochelatase, mitochondrial-like [Pollicipes pollicipes]|uniref:LOW QUALITY PROTEIN: ferrochelatase, mitochondrial-like n=1 Tax=Pollicipes pollicipes TaxID=41117 RepID=UPI0018859966|nr:LOW QUALITY PROTEIN: ferrochelatase, mitochondrial-like [Pollicipes pollicipes]